MSFTGKINSNWRVDNSGQFGAALLGSNIVAGSFLPAAAGGAGGASTVGGGFVMGSFTSGLSGVGFLQISAFGALSAFFGSGIAGSGYKIVPFAYQDFSGDGVSSPVFYVVSATQALASVDSIFVIRVNKASQNIGSGVMFTSASNISVHFVWAGWIVSTPAAVP